MVGLDGKSSTLEAAMNYKAKYFGFQSRKYKNGAREENKKLSLFVPICDHHL